jgi:hypothetical protein
MDFFIKKNATLPVLKLQVVKDGRSDYDNFMKTIELSSIFFSMVDADTGIPKISSKPAGFVEKTFIDPNAEPEYYIYYQLTPKDTNRVGKYEGQFMLRNDDGVLILPIREKLHIYVQESFIADDLAYESCYVSEFPCCVNGPYTTTTTTTPCVPCVSPTPPPSSLPSPTPTPTPIPSPILDECTVLILAQTSLYAYFPSTNTKLLLDVDGLTNSLDIAHTTTKMWINSSSSLYEYNITLNPWSATFNRTINIPSEYILGDGLGAISNTQVISTIQISGKIVILDITTNTAVPTEIGTLKPNRVVLGDILLTTTNKIILTNLDFITGDEYITQYSYPSGTIEIEVKINPTISVANGLFTDNDNLYIASSTVNGPIYTIDLDYPYNITYVDDSSIRLQGASQVPNCNNVNLNSGCELTGFSYNIAEVPSEFINPILIDDTTYISVGPNQYLTF